MKHRQSLQVDDLKDNLKCVLLHEPMWEAATFQQTETCIAH